MAQLRVVLAKHGRRQHRALPVCPVTGGAQAGRQRVLGIERQQRGGGLQLVLAGVVTNDLPLLQRGVQAGQQRQSARAGQGAQRGGVVGRQHAGIKGMGAFQCLQHK